ncbi:hypothetical protein [Mycoplasmopsis columboralis]|uniref:SMODS and SLOG-associating 2TM effector domain-containing protein n=1 Tax=Mycoplasmopsis columboralis TaxID=171282 RepID=A0A449B7I8_9BACT|nr:hypothetical protein [Mycoplasmopsis columboralis]VEU76561.1 Uncharacterised protein [Mycoplasmopsis columboralis]
MNDINEKIYCSEIISKSKSKYRKSYYTFVGLNVALIVITALTIILNLFAMRYNPYPQQTMIYFVLLAIFAVIISFISSVQTFLSIKDQKTSIGNNIYLNEQIIERIQNKDIITRDDIDDILNTF